jgi:hypothetical protein
MRKDNWPRLLEDFIIERKDIPFDWGTNDCWQFSIHAVKEISDKDLTSLFDYQTPRKAAELMNEHGGMVGAADKYFGESKSILLAQRGDVVCLINDGRELLGVCLGELSAFVAESGVIMQPTLNCEKAWSI